MKLVALILCLLAEQTWAMGPFPDGTYYGRGHWTGSNHTQGDYTVGLTIQGFTFAFSYRFFESETTKGSEGTMGGHFSLEPNGYFQVKYDGESVMQGTCTQNTCAFGVKNSEVSLEQVWTTVSPNEIHCFGTKTKSGITLKFDQTLIKPQ